MFTLPKPIKPRLIRKIICLITAVTAMSPCFANETSTGRFIDRVDFLTEFYIYQDVRTFTNHKNAELREAYLVSAETEFEAIFVSLDSILHFGMLYSNYLGMGRQSAAILFDPREANYALVPYFEFRHQEIFYQIGLDHRCFHQIDRKTRSISPYWNQIYIRASSANYRFPQMRKNYIDAGRNTYLDNLRWQVTAGYFVSKFGGMDRTLISGGHPWRATAAGDIGYSFYRSESWILSGHNKITLLSDTSGTPFWIGGLGIDADVHNRGYAIGFFINYNYEFSRNLPLFSNDQLIELGIRFRY
ncbi:MAG: hypothetical protein LBC70_01980 [Chitinispirillales bacterium]|jgi:hypothetical protein|nr:hypothetical protein [Chitinispirillales bacterium]